MQALRERSGVIFSHIADPAYVGISPLFEITFRITVTLTEMLFSRIDCAEVVGIFTSRCLYTFRASRECVPSIKLVATPREIF